MDTKNFSKNSSSKEAAIKDFGLNDVEPSTSSLKPAAEKPKTGAKRKSRRNEKPAQPQQNTEAKANETAADDAEVTEPDAGQNFDYKKYKKTNKDKENARPKRHVSFKTVVDVFLLGDAWKSKKITTKLRTEEEQQASRIGQRNF